MKLSVTFSDLTLDEAMALIPANSNGKLAPVAAASAPPPPAGNAAPPPPPRAAGAPPPPPAPSGAPPPPPANAAPPPPPAPPANPMAAKAAEALAAMGPYAQRHKSAGVKEVLAQVGATKIQDVTDAAQLDWLIATFKAGAA